MAGFQASGLALIRGLDLWNEIFADALPDGYLPPPLFKVQGLGVEQGTHCVCDL